MHNTTMWTSPGDGGNRLAGWQIALIVIAVVILAVILTMLAVFIMLKKNRGLCYTCSHNKIIFHSRVGIEHNHALLIVILRQIFIDISSLLCTGQMKKHNSKKGE